LGAEFLVGEVGEGGVEEEGEDLGEGGGVDEVGCFVEEAAEGWGRGGGSGWERGCGWGGEGGGRDGGVGCWRGDGGGDRAGFTEDGGFLGRRREEVGEPALGSEVSFS